MSRYLKSVVAVLVAGLTALQAAISDDRVTNNEWVIIALAVIGAVGVCAVPNTKPDGEPVDPTVSEREHGAADVTGLVVTVLLVVVLVLVILRLA